ncbi:hypothetical protein Bca4012_068900 [Brassica carinata]
MEEAMGSWDTRSGEQEEEEKQVLKLPGFRFHPTDEELVGFYLSKKVLLKKSSKIDEIISQIDIYKFDPWDLPRSRSAEKESYFFCRRGRKYRNSIRPNRVTGSGFWKATGIDKPVYSDGPSKAVIGLKKTLEVWTLCRIFKRNVSSRKYTPDWRELAGGRRMKPQKSKYQEAYISFGDNESSSSTNNINVMERKDNYERNVFQLQQTPHQHQPIPVDTTITTQVDNTVPHFSNDNIHDITYENWDELRSVVEFAFGPSSFS